MLDYQSTEQQLDTPQKQPTVALLHCYDLIEDFLDSINISFETFCDRFIGSWMFGYINALQRVGVQTILFCISAQVTEPSRFTHLPTGATICMLPASQSYRAYRTVRRKALSLYGGSEGQSFTDIHNSKSKGSSVLTKVKDLAKSVGNYLSTPLELLAQEMQREGCDAILCQEYEYARFDACVLLGKLMRLPVFASFQGGDETQSLVEYPLRLLALRGCTGLIIAPQTELQRVRDRYKIPTNKLARIFNPVDVASWRAIDRNAARTAVRISLTAKVVVCHGRIELHRKGLDILLDAWDRICRQRPEQELQLLLVGTGPDANQLRDRIAAMQLRGLIWQDEFINDRTRVQQYLSAADVYVMSSRQEGFPVAPIEAMACSLPIVATDALGIPDILEHGETSGGLVVPRNNASALANAIGRVLDNPDWGQELGRRARLRVEQQFASEAVGQQLRDFLLLKVAPTEQQSPQTFETKSLS